MNINVRFEKETPLDKHKECRRKTEKKKHNHIEIIVFNRRYCKQYFPEVTHNIWLGRHLIPWDGNNYQQQRKISVAAGTTPLKNPLHLCQR